MSKTSRACIVIPIYKTEITSYEQISMDQCFRIMEGFDVFFIIPQRLEKYIRSNVYYLSGRASYKVFKDSFFNDIPGYNRLMKSPVFYGSFLAYEYLLMYQLDAFVFRNELLKWCDMGYADIGAPLFEGHDTAGPNSILTGQGNGGFCLRNVRACYDIVRTWKRLAFIRKFDDIHPSLLKRIYRYIKHQLLHNYSRYPFQPIINEDLFWSEVIPEVFPDFKVPAPEQAVAFSFEVNPAVLYQLNNENLPFGCHAWWRYDLKFWKKHIECYGYEL